MAKWIDQSVRTGTVLLVWSLLTCVHTSDIITRNLTSPNDTRPVILNHLILDNETNNLYVGAVNRVFRLSCNLTVKNFADTGPKNDSQRCWLNAYEDPSICSWTKLPTDNHNKILLYHSLGDQRRILTCGTLFQGLCESRNHMNLSVYTVYPIAVATNDPGANTVAFISRVDSLEVNSNQAIFTASDFFNDTSLSKDDFALLLRTDRTDAIAIRNVQSPDDTFKRLQDGGSFMRYNSDYIKAGILKFITGFSSGHFNYLLMTEKMENNNQEYFYRTKLAHMCQKDVRFNGFIDIPLVCHHNNTFFTRATSAKVISPPDIASLNSDGDILAVTFQNDELPQRSAVCVYDMRYIQKIVLKNINGCRQGNTSFAQKKFKDGNIDEQLLCPMQFPERISGIIPAENEAAIVFEQTVVTSIALTTTTEFIVAFVGTSLGKIIKLVIKSNTTAQVFGDMITVDAGSPIAQDMVFDRDSQYIFTMSLHKVARIKLHDCDQYKTCTECLSSKDPYCGWCTLENKCVVKSECPNPTVSRWRKYGRGQEDCIVIMDIAPPMASVEMSNLTLFLTVMDLPKNTNYSCEFDFGHVNVRTQALPWSSGLGCATPNVSNLQDSFRGIGYQSVGLGVLASETNKVVVRKDYTFYMCSSFTSCTACVDNRFWCNWCVSENRCTYDPQQTQCLGNVIYSRNRNGNYGRNGPLHCPRVDLATTGKVYVPNGRARSVIIRGRNLPMENGQGGYKATIRTCTQGEVTVSGNRINNTHLLFPIPSIEEKLVNGVCNADMNITWGNGFSLDSQGLYLTLYSCSGMANGDCSLCKHLETSEPGLNCRWCEGECVYSTMAMCLRNQCPGPMITKVTPSSGHYLGGTHVTITGTNLGSSFQDIDHNVSIANIACAPIRELYQPAKQIVCKIGSSSGEHSGLITIMRQQIPDFVFYYRKPIVRQVHPSKKAQSGGGDITLYGQYLSTGNSLSVLVNGSECSNIRRYNQSSARCTVPRSPDTGTVPLGVKIDGMMVETTGVMFQYVLDPTILSIQPQESFRSGGRRLTVQGTNLDAVDTPKIFAWVQQNGVTDKTTESDCTLHNDTTMFCPSPTIPVQGESQTQPSVNLIRLKRSVNMLTAEIGFIMDGVLSVRNLSGDFPLTYYTDPIVTPFKDEKDGSEIKKKGDVLIISGVDLTVAASRSDVRVIDMFLCFQGVDLTRAASRSDVRVNVGNAQCNVTNLAEDKIYCDPPTRRPTDDGSQRSDGMPRVIVTIGRRSWFIGYLQYEEEANMNLMLYILLGVAGCAALIMVIVVFTCVWYRRQRNKAEREKKKIQIQLDNLESNVRQECKQAFAELQTDMTDLTKELDASKKPFYSYEDYTFKVLFPGNVDHVILHPPQQWNGNVDRHPDVAIQHFNTLLHNKQFLLMFIRTLERQKTFSIRDKSSVASLLIILFQNNMEYITEILKCLLHDLIEKSIESKHPKLMLRRTESVVEKLLANWLSLCLYKHLIDSAGSSLYTLYQAIKVQVDKGPVDQLTGDARYSLSEDRLLRTEIKLEPVQLTLNVEYDGRKTKCRVLDCDTITQAKEKMLDMMFRNFPYSQRPCATDLDLEWIQCSKSLSDEDSSTQKVDGWKQLNTLKHYGVIDGAVMVLTQHQNCRTLPRSPNGKYHETLPRYLTLPRSPNGSVHSSGFQFSREAVPITRTESEMGCRYWHLVKQDDNQTSLGGIKLSSEIYLTRLLSTKGTLKKYIDDFFQTLLTANSSMPPVIKYLFDFLDEAARKHGLHDPDIVYTWKCNSLLLRFWVNIIKNPDFLYDINKPNIIDSCLSVVAQTFMDSCSTSDHQLNPDSPTNKLLFAKDIPHYKELVEKYFLNIKALSPVSDQDLNAYLAEVSRVC
ncbi:hypothetical protein FSP39_006810 [Pinctada imbricata]|uniref:Sema domain-containing protein n=1 Tax=Pinctada imbricata TaxID=66713 RepID=A0AA89C6T4_PINIB|nr:hypothetical protein FSP39_006810 [Pinctada imbricata]